MGYDSRLHIYTAPFVAPDADDPWIYDGTVTTIEIATVDLCKVGYDSPVATIIADAIKAEKDRIEQRPQSDLGPRSRPARLPLHHRPPERGRDAAGRGPAVPAHQLRWRRPDRRRRRARPSGGWPVAFNPCPVERVEVRGSGLRLGPSLVPEKNSPEGG